MIIVADVFDLRAICRPGMVLRTRDRREARVESISRDGRLIFGQVRMHGACVWRSDGRYRDAPFGAVGPLDLMPPAAAEPSAPGPQKTSIEAALAEDYRLYCCD